jgi:hypothetical protein
LDCIGNKIDLDLFSEFSPTIEMTEFSVEQGIDIPLTSQDTVTINAVVSTRNNRGTGSLTTSFRRVLPDLSWFRVRIFLSFILHQNQSF